jgi:O-antigen/teichoic acid export membrane protein
LVTQISDVFDSQWDKLVLAHFVDPAAVTSFFVGTSLTLQAKVIGAIPLAPILVAVAEGRATSFERSRMLQVRLMKQGSVLASATLGALFVFAPAFIELWLGRGHDDAARAARYFTLAVLINLMIAPAALQAYGEGRQHLAALGAMCNLIVNAIFSLVLTMHIGLMGAVYGSILGNLIGALGFTSIARRRLSYWLWPRVRAIVLACVIGGTVLLLHVDRPRTWPVLVGEVIAFVGVVFVLGARLERLRLADFRQPRIAR